MKCLLPIVLFLAAPAVLAQDLTIPPRPEPARFVNDYANMLSASDEGALEQKLLDFDEQSSTQIVIVTIETLAGHPIEEYSIELAETWGIGQRGLDNGVLLLMAKNEREVRIEVGYGLEGAIPDAIARRIIADSLVPNFRRGDFFAGFDRATDELIALSRGEFTAEELFPERRANPQDVAAGRTIIYTFTLFLLTFTILLGRKLGASGTLYVLGTIALVILSDLWTEYDYWPDRQGSSFFLRLILIPLVLFAIGWSRLIQLRIRRTRFDALQREVSPEHWKRLKLLYDTEQVEQSRRSLFQEASVLDSSQGKPVIDLRAKTRAIHENPRKHFRRRNEADLIEAREKLEKAAIFDDECFLATERDRYQEKLAEDISYFERRSLVDLEPADRKRLDDSVAAFTLILEDPAAMLGLNEPLVREKVKKWMQAIERKFGRYKGSYTSASIKKTKASFMEKHAAALKQADAARALYLLYTGSLLALEASPGKFLVKIVLRSSSSYRSTGSSFRSSSSFSSSSSSFRSSSFGGGSFGGGGASGRW